MDIYLSGDAKTDQAKTVQVARNILQTTVNDSNLMLILIIKQNYTQPK